MFLTERSIEKAVQHFEENFTLRNEIGASLSIWFQGEEIVNLATGFCEKEKSNPWTKDTIIPVYSATKGPASATLLLALEKHGHTPDTLVTHIWPEFPNKSATIAQLMSHQCGLSAIDKIVSTFDYNAVIGAIESQEPNWALGSGHGYHPRTYGFLLDELCLRLEGQRIGSCFREWIANPLAMDMWIGLPENQHHRVATLYPGKMDKNDLLSDFYKDFNKPGTLAQRTFSSPKGLNSVQEMNKPEAWMSGLPAMGGVATATALAKFYQAAIGEIKLFSPQLQDWMASSIISGDDKVLKTPTRFSCGFQLDPLNSFGQKIRHNYGLSENAFGHPGAGGSHAFGDPDSGISLAYTMNQMELAVLPNIKSLGIIEALYS